MTNGVSGAMKMPEFQQSTIKENKQVVKEQTQISKEQDITAVKQAEVTQQKNVTAGDSNHAQNQHKEKDQNGQSQQQPKFEPQELQSTINKANSQLKNTNSELSFSINEKTQQVLVKLVDSETKELIREIPPEKIVNMMAEMRENAGLFVNETI
ncbi:MAG: hypothetical protein ATN36_01305 [Epulopiscium sp. Nele67-Bin005]|nr:MAG: hypothetical protein ATN36_01305 [Epulopiscium sp. Nele67-Bin005]